MGRPVGWYGPVDGDVYAARNGVCVCGAKKALRTAWDWKSWIKLKGGGHGFIKTAILVYQSYDYVVWKFIIRYKILLNHISNHTITGPLIISPKSLPCCDVNRF